MLKSIMRRLGALSILAFPLIAPSGVHAQDDGYYEEDVYDEYHWEYESLDNDWVYETPYGELDEDDGYYNGGYYDYYDYDYEWWADDWDF